MSKNRIRNYVSVYEVYSDLGSDGIIKWASLDGVVWTPHKYIIKNKGVKDGEREAA